MSKLLKCIAAGMTLLLLNGCFFVGQVRDKIYEDCAIHPDHIKNLPPAEYERLAGKCGWNKQQNQAADNQSKSLMNTARLCHEIVTAPPTQGKRNEQFLYKQPNGLTLQYRVADGVVPDLKVLYPNGSTETYTRFVNGKAEGWSEGYYPSGKIRTRFFYQNGKAKRYEVYREDGTVIERKELNCR